jgi:cytidine deaminase
MTFSKSPISKFRVGAVAETHDGTLLLGTNLEFVGHPLNQSVHAEQFVTVLARYLGFDRLKKLAISAEPCGHCRQWLNEIENAGQIQIQILDQPPADLASYSRPLFGPQNLGLSGGLLSRTQVSLQVAPQPLGATVAAPTPASARRLDEAHRAAEKSYAPYSKAYSAVAILLDNDQVVTGPCLENAAFNPSLSPLQTAWVAQWGLGWGHRKILQATLVETEDRSGQLRVSYAQTTQSLLQTEGFVGPFEVRRLRF